MIFEKMGRIWKYSLIYMILNFGLLSIISIFSPFVITINLLVSSLVSELTLLSIYQEEQKPGKKL